MSKTNNRREVRATTTQDTKGVAAKKRNQPNAEELYNLGNCCIERKEYDKALSYYERTLKANPAHCSACFMAAQIHQRKYDNQKALDYWRKYRCLAADNKSESDEDIAYAVQCIKILEHRIYISSPR